MLQPYLSTLSDSTNQPTINYKTLLRWLTQMQGSEIELGGFKGRTNKLVDGCYSWWVGGAFPLLQSLGVGKQHHGEDPQHVESDAGTDHWDDVDGECIGLGCNQLIVTCFQRLLVQPQSTSRVYSVRGPTSCGWSERQASKVRPHSILLLKRNLVLNEGRSGTRTRITLYIVYLVSLLRSIVFYHLLRGEQNCRMLGNQLQVRDVFLSISILTVN